MANSSLATAYVQVVPTTDGIKDALVKEFSGSGEESGSSFGASFANKLKMAISSMAIGKTIAKAVDFGSDLEQSLGGVETMFKQNSNIIKKYANEAYKTAGVSANQYMEQVTSFSASLIQSLSGDTKKAAELSNTAMIDMSDNANKFGTDIESIQNAYQGFAKQNFTMLDNLKLGYGGTKTEMERLINDANKVKIANGEMANLSIDSFGDMVEAIHIIQEEIGVTGTTALEGATTVKGSFSAMKASAENLLGNMALGKNVSKSFKALISTSSTYLFGNLLPMVGNVVKSIPIVIKSGFGAIANSGMDMLVEFAKGFSKKVPTMMSTALDSVQSFATYIAQQMPTIINKGFEMLNYLVDGIIKGLPVMIQKLPQIITTFANIINNNMPTILLKGFEILVKLVSGIISAIPTLIANIPQIINAIVSSLMAFNWLKVGSSIVNGIGNGLKSMVGYVKGCANSILNGLKVSFSGISNIGVNLVKGLWNGIDSVKNWIISKIKGFGNSVLNGLKSFFGIHSPSRVMRDEIGKYLPEGIAVGINANADEVYKSMNNLSQETLNIASNGLAFENTTVSTDNTSVNQMKAMIELLEVIANKKEETVINLNDREVARALKELGVVIE